MKTNFNSPTDDTKNSKKDEVLLYPIEIDVTIKNGAVKLAGTFDTT